jgi:hypothetical protein
VQAEHHFLNLPNVLPMPSPQMAIYHGLVTPEHDNVLLRRPGCHRAVVRISSGERVDPSALGDRSGIQVPSRRTPTFVCHGCIRSTRARQITPSCAISAMGKRMALNTMQPTDDPRVLEEWRAHLGRS